MGRVGSLVSVLFYSAISVMVALVVLVFLLRLTNRVAPGVSSTVQNLTGLAA